MTEFIPKMDLRKKVHSLKSWSSGFQSLISGDKRHEFRRNDRDFELGDHVHLREFDPEIKGYTGFIIYAVITAISYGPEWGIPEGYAAMTIKPYLVDKQSPVFEAK